MGFIHENLNIFRLDLLSKKYGNLDIQIRNINEKDDYEVEVYLPFDLKNILKKKFDTTIIGSLAAFEEKFGEIKVFKKQGTNQFKLPDDVLPN